MTYERRSAVKVTILGAGGMGSAMALRLIDTEHQGTVWNRSSDRLAALADAGASVNDDASAAVTEAAVVVTMVTDGAAVHSLATQLLPAMPADAVWVQASTVVPAGQTGRVSSPQSRRPTEPAHESDASL